MTLHRVWKEHQSCRRYIIDKKSIAVVHLPDDTLDFGGIEANGKSAAGDSGAVVDRLVEHELRYKHIAHRLTAQSISSAGAQPFVHLGNHFIILLLLSFRFAGCHIFQKLAPDESPCFAAGILICRDDSGASFFIESVLALSE